MGEKKGNKKRVLSLGVYHGGVCTSGPPGPRTRGFKKIRGEEKLDVMGGAVEIGKKISQQHNEKIDKRRRVFSTINKEKMVGLLPEG